MHRAGSDVNALRAYKQQAMAGVYRILAQTLGEPPQEFTWRAPKKDKKKKKEAEKAVVKTEKPALGGPTETGEAVAHLDQSTAETIRLSRRRLTALL